MGVRVQLGRERVWVENEIQILSPSLGSYEGCIRKKDKLYKPRKRAWMLQRSMEQNTDPFSFTNIFHFFSSWGWAYYLTSFMTISLCFVRPWRCFFPAVFYAIHIFYSSSLLATRQKIVAPSRHSIFYTASLKTWLSSVDRNSRSKVRSHHLIGPRSIMILMTSLFSIVIKQLITSTGSDYCYNIYVSTASLVRVLQSI